MDKRKVIIAISGYARTGKDTLCKFLIDEYKKYGFVAKRFSFADALKEDLKDYVSSYGYDIFSLDGEEKELFRPLMVWKGFYHRSKTSGTYFCDILDKKISDDKDVDVAIITDLRYAEYEKDELQFVKDRGGFVIALSRILDRSLGRYQLPANNEENLNFEIIRKNADLDIELPNIFDRNGNIIEDRKMLIQLTLDKITGLHIA